MFRYIDIPIYCPALSNVIVGIDTPTFDLILRVQGYNQYTKHVFITLSSVQEY